MQDTFVKLLTRQGLQTAGGNIANRVRGLQLGLINIAGEADAQVGLISVNKSGYNHLYLLGASADPWAVGLTYGGKCIYSLAEYSYRPQQSTLSLGLGWH